MDAKKLGTSLILLGIVLMIAAGLWWWHFYGPLADTLHTDLSHAFSCLYSNGGVCSLATAAAQLSGKTPYSPVLGWAGAVFAVLGILMKVSSR